MKQTGNKHKGCVGEYYAMYDACSKGYLVSKMVESDLLGYDLVMDDGDKLYRVEVKTSDKSRRSNSSGLQFEDRVIFDLTSTTSCGNVNNYQYVHWFALFCPKWKKIAWLKREDAKSKKMMYISDFNKNYYQLPINNRIIQNTSINEMNFINNQVNLF